MNKYKLKIQRYYNFAITKFSKAKWRRTHFLVANRHIGSTLTRGDQISQQLNQLGIYSRVFELDYSLKRVEDIKDSIFIIVKAAPQNKYDILSALKKNGNILVWDPVDSLEDLRGEAEASLFDGVILSSNKCKDETVSYFRNNCAYGVIPHHWDRRCLVNHAQDYQLLYFGDTTPENISQEYINEIEELHTEKCSNEKSFLNILRSIAGYNCHFSVREDHSDSFKYKPAVKVSFASATNSNIILSRDYSNVELLGASYPYYTDSNLESVKKTVQYSKETFGTKVWVDALAMMKDVRERTSIYNVCNEYIRYLKYF